MVSSTSSRVVPPAQPQEFRPLQYRAFEVWPPVVLAPMAGVTNPVFRSLCRKFGAGLYVSEMITARGLVEGHATSRKFASFAPEESPRSLQLYGTDSWTLGEATRWLTAEGRVDHLDLNFGCPVRKVTAAGGGAAIPIKPRRMARLIRAVIQNAGAIPVSIKVRLGIDETHLSYLDSGRVAEQEGCVAIGLHARTASQLYDGEARWSAIGELKAAVHKIQVLGNGDLWECWDALRMMRETQCDGVIVGRGCLGRPWLFAELADVFEGRVPRAAPELGAVIQVLAQHAHELVAWFGDHSGILELRKWCAWYLKGFSVPSAVRARLAQLRSLEELTGLLSSLDPREPFPQSALRARRAKRAGTQTVALPFGYLENDACPKAEEPELETAGGG